MAGTFWQTMREFEPEARSLRQLQTAACAEMLDLQSQTAKTITKSRELMAHVDEILARDGWRTPAAGE